MPEPCGALGHMACCCTEVYCDGDQDHDGDHCSTDHNDDGSTTVHHWPQEAHP